MAIVTVPETRIRTLQFILRALAQQDGAPNPIVPDGIYGPKTRNAVLVFQRQNELPMTGEVDYATWEALEIAYRHITIQYDPAAPLQIVLSPYQTINPGEDNTHTLLIQALFQGLGKHYVNTPPCPSHGKYDSATEEAVRWLQSCGGLPITGVVDKPTWAELTRVYFLTVHDGTGDFPVRVTQKHTP
ncbi:MAG: peptidoglycan-binding protein [Oscillospiraceae bacterium]|jgi:peptidoglycan hydrolase-like protein with peptidoglycan-binding domain|nr:peptidoglycan-binding protein [Oscillospiraceae bacterium]